MVNATSCAWRRRVICFGVLGALTVLAPAGPATASDHQAAPPAPFVTVGGHRRSTAGLQGHRTFLWLLSTWCGSCAAGLKAVAEHAGQLRNDGLRVVILRNYKDDGYPGPGIRAFFARAVPGFRAPSNWTLGQTSKQLDQSYNPRHYPDVYFLIDSGGDVRAVGSAPAATMGRILHFAKSSN